MTVSQDHGNMSLRDARELYMHIEKEEILNKYTFPSKPGKDGYYRVYVSDSTKKAGRRQLFAKDIGTLKEKVYDYEKGISGRVRKTFHDAYEIVLTEKIKYLKDPEEILSRQNTLCKNRSDFKRFFGGTEFEHKYVDEISKVDIENIVYFNLERYYLRRKALEALEGILRSTFKLAFDENWIDDNPFLRANFSKYSGLIKRNVDNNNRVHSDTEFFMILNEIHAHQAKKPYYIPAYALEMQMIVGDRRAETAPLKRSDIQDGYVHFTRQQLTIKRFENIPEHFAIVNHTKTYTDRDYPIYDCLKPFLEKLFGVLDKYYPDSEFLFPADNKNGVITNNAVYGYYRRVCHKLGIKLSREEMKGPHSFRRNAITEVVNASSGDLVLASKLFGNSPAVAYKNYYTGINDENALNALNQRKICKMYS